MPAASGPTVQVFGVVDSRPTQAALRFFKERRVPIHFVDLRRKPIAPGELRRFVDRLGARSLADEDGKAWLDGGLAYLRMDDDELAGRLLADPRLIRLPLVRNGAHVTAGVAEAAWREWLRAADPAASPDPAARPPTR